MDIKILTEEKGMIEVELPNVTLAELLRVYLNKDSGVEFAAWKRNHPTELPILKVESKDPKKSIKSAIVLAIKDLDVVEADFKKLK